MTKSFPPRPRALSLVLVLVLVVGTFIPALATVAQAQEQTGATATKDFRKPLSMTRTRSVNRDLHGHLPERRSVPGHGDVADRDGAVRRSRFAEQRDAHRHRVHAAGRHDGHRPRGHTRSGSGVYGHVRGGHPRRSRPLQHGVPGPSGHRVGVPNFTPPLTAGAFATHTLLVVCQPTITVTKTADTVQSRRSGQLHHPGLQHGPDHGDQAGGDRFADR